MIYLDNAATSWPKPENVYRTMDSFLREKGGSPGRGSHSMAIAATSTIEETRLLMARFINAPEKERIIFTLNCTDALNLGLKGLLQPGDHVITDSMEHNSVVRPLRKLERQGVKITWLKPSESGIVLPEDVEAAITPNTRLVVMIHASNVNGVIQPIEEYGAVARKHNLVFMVDAAQSMGKYAIDVQSANIDLLAFPGHKGLFGPPGTGALYIGERADLDSIREGGTGIYGEMEEQPSGLPYRYESGTPNSVGIAGLGAGLKYITNERLEKIRVREEHLVSLLIEGLSAIPEVTLYCTAAQQAPIISFNIKGYEPGEVGAVLDQSFDIKVRTGLHCAVVAHKTIGTYPLGTVRLSPGYFNTEAEVDMTLQAITQIARMGSPSFMAGKEKTG